jgi:quercetin dioxygenase-like cupin family protein
MRALTIVIGTLFSMTAAVAAQAAEAPKVTVAPVFSTDTTVTGQKIEVPANPHVAVSLATFPPGAALAVHKHPYPHYVYVLEGTLTVTNSETGKVFDVPAGGFLVEMNNTWHFGKNNGAVPVKLLVIDQLPPGVTSNVIAK